MLVDLAIDDLVLISEARLSFVPGLNVITGETGAGKSVIVGALNLVLGERADKTLIRTGADQCAVEAVVQLGADSDVHGLLDELGIAPCEDGQLIVRRQFNAAGTGKCFVNDTPATVQALKRMGDLLVDMHGPHDHQSLLSREFQLDLLDASGRLEKPRTAYEHAYRRWLDLQQQRDALNNETGNPAQQIDFLKFQIKEIEDADLEGVDETELVQEHTRVANAQRILELAGAVQGALNEDDASAFSALTAAQKHLSELARIVPEAEPWRTEAASIASQAQELAHAVVGFAGKIDADPQRLQWLEERMATIHRLKRKYGGSLAEILQFLENARQQLRDLETRGERAEKLEAEIKAARAEIDKCGRDLAKQRRAAAKKLAAAITEELRDLGFAHGAFDVGLSTLDEPGPRGLDGIEFSFAPNAGEEPRPLRMIASSGEISRVMLAVKTVLAAHDRVPVLVFDEVDANVGGEMGNAIGEKLRAVAKARQVICITHLPQVAARGKRHHVVSKALRNGRTLASIEPVTEKSRVEELARMLGGKELTSVTTRHAKEMLQKLGGV
jgi:DNA repair protein RecN (Recombination protein N)